MTTIDAAELDLLRSTAREVFAGDASLADLGELGVLGLLTPEEHGGDGWRVVEAVAVAVEAGRALSPLPWSGTLLAAAAVVGSPAHAGLAEDLLAGKAVGAFTERVSDAAGATVTGSVQIPGTVPPAVLVLAPGSADGTILVSVQPDPAWLRSVPEDEVLDTVRGQVVLDLADVAARVLPTPDGAGIAAAAVLLSCADTLGALAATAERVTRYLGEREAFGRPLAAFQVLQHRLADLTVLVAAADALVQAAATALAQRSPRAEHLVDLAHAFLADRATAALDDCIQLSGGIGFTWEWPVHHAMRRALVNAGVRVRRPPSVARLRAALAGAGPELPGTEDVRARVRAVLAEHTPPTAREGHRAPETPEQEAALRSWYRTLFDTGLLGGSWPAQWGGRPDHDPVHDLVVTEELIRARGPRPLDQVMLAAHVLLHHGTPAQQQRYLPRIRTAQDVWCQLFSEPGAGSDLAGVRARAVHRADGSWVADGQKTWTTDGHWAQYGLALLRTSTTGGRHDGLTLFVVPMDAPGVEVRPIRTIGGVPEFNEVFLDGVELGADQVVGEVGRGWAVMMGGLEFERLGVGANVVLLELLLEDVLTVVEQVVVDGAALADDSAVRAAITWLIAESAAAGAFVTGHVARVLAGREGAADASVAKVVYTEAYNRIARYGTELAAHHGPVPAAANAAAGRLRDAWLWSRALTISGGSSEVMRNIIAKRGLRLPSGR